MRRRPHTVTVVPVLDDVKADGSVYTPYETTGTTEVKGQLTPMNPAEAYDEVGVEIQAPHLFLCNLDDADTFRVNYRVQFGTRTFQVKKAIKRWGAGDRTNCTEIVLGEMLEGVPV